jgi:hypothetical protein
VIETDNRGTMGTSVPSAEHRHARRISEKWKWLGVAALFAFCVAPTFISYQPYLFGWDDAEYLQRAILVSRAFWSLNVHGLGAAMVSIRPPIMTLMGLPWGPLPSWEAAGKCFISLVAAISLLVALCLSLLQRLGVKPLFLLIAGVCIFASLGPFPAGAAEHWDATAFLADSLFAWTTLAALLLIPCETRIVCPSTTGAVLRGLLWAAILSLGMMTKMSFLYFVVLIVPLLFFIRLSRVGVRGALVALVAFVCGSAPAVLYLARWGQKAWVNARASSFGGVADFYGQTTFHALGTYLRESPGFALSLALMASALLYVIVRRRRVLLGPAFLAILIEVGFAIVVFASPNKQIRYAFPVIVGLPILIALLLSNHEDSVSTRSAAWPAALAFCGLVLAGVPTSHRAQKEIISRSNAVLAQAAQCGAKRILIATDNPTLNKPLMDVANEVRVPPTVFEVNTLAYGAMFSTPIEDDFKQIRDADLVVFQYPEKWDPPFTNQRVPEYYHYIRQNGYVATRVWSDVVTYTLQCNSQAGQTENPAK